MKVTRSLIGTTRPTKPTRSGAGRSAMSPSSSPAPSSSLAAASAGAPSGSSTPLGTMSILAGGRAVGELLAAVDLGEGHDPRRLRVGEPRQRAEEPRPEPAQRRDARRPGGRAQAEPAVVGLGGVADPVGARQLHLALARVDAVLGDASGRAGPPAPDRGQQARVAGGDGVVAGRRHHRRGQQAQQRDVDGAEVPEQIEERRLRRRRRSASSVSRSKLARPCRSSASGQIVGGQIGEDAPLRRPDRPAALEVQAAEARQHARRLRRGRRRRRAASRICSRSSARARPVERRAGRLLAEDAVQADHVGGELVARLAVGARVRADVQHREAQLGMAEDDVVHPGRDAARDEGVGPLDQQADVGVQGFSTGTSRVLAGAGTWTTPTVTPRAAGRAAARHAARRDAARPTGGA